MCRFLITQAVKKEDQAQILLNIANKWAAATTVADAYNLYAKTLPPQEFGIFRIQNVPTLLCKYNGRAPRVTEGSSAAWRQKNVVAAVRAISKVGEEGDPEPAIAMLDDLVKKHKANSEPFQTWLNFTEGCSLFAPTNTNSRKKENLSQDDQAVKKRYNRWLHKSILYDAVLASGLKAASELPTLEEPPPKPVTK